MAKEPQSRDLRECIKLIKEMTTIIDPADDYLTITAAEEQMKINYAKAKRENDEAYSNLKALSRVLEAARKSSARPPNVPAPEQHAARLNELDSTRISLAKALRDAENSLASKEAELAALKEGARALEESDPAQSHQGEIDGTTLRLQIFRGMGFDIVLDSDGKASTMFIRAESGDVHTLAPRGSDYHSVEQAWKLATS
ncbi:hypothetical protein F5J12DRAFT_805501 [Pisolithus orientalis]|uniref:uncharacterized protein n=1 Tax=Pisolithus orientalis TaxID=936130 RepID=UPI0022250713|nr:uncharacterized protein F5J12DRAFT_805501 [Pisolithus orientalis]KAI6028454.1 hypothetical protein F5J12DRAFT_805501 [Pisolithus orientalis]